MVRCGVRARTNGGAIGAAADARTGRASRRAARSIQARREPRGRRRAGNDPAHERSGVQLRRARIPGVRDDEVPHRHPQAERLHHRRASRGHSDGVDGDVGIGQAGDRARVRHRRHPAGVAEARCRLPRSDHRGRARPRRGAQLRHAAADCGGTCREEGHGAAAPAGHAALVARRGRGAATAPRRIS